VLINYSGKDLVVRFGKHTIELPYDAEVEKTLEGDPVDAYLDRPRVLDELGHDRMGESLIVSRHRFPPYRLGEPPTLYFEIAGYGTGARRTLEPRR
jgi:hypothetical protein